jgi:hypothetical protein
MRHLLPAMRCLLLASATCLISTFYEDSYALPATCYLEREHVCGTCYLLSTTCYLLPTKCYLLPPAVRTRMSYMLSTKCHLLPAT